jgi:futalosine hydrolase
VNLLLCVATEIEATTLRGQLPQSQSVRLVQTGVGPVNAAHAVTLAIMERRPDSIVCCGVGGAYPSSRLHIGDVVCAETEIYGDLGAQSPTGFLDMRALGFPVVNDPEPLFNELPMQVFPIARRVRFVTVSTCTGTDTVAHDIETRTRGAIENMEGAAIAHVAHLHHIPVGEVRGVSNIVRNRDKTSWQLREASEAAQRAVIDWLRTLRP